MNNKTMRYMKQILLSSTVLLTLLCAGCEKTYDEPAEQLPVTMQANMTIKELKALYKQAPTMVNAPSGIIAGKVISTDKYGNFYRSIYIQDETAGIEIKIGKTTMYNTYRIGQTVYIKPHHFCLGAYGGMVSLGVPSGDSKYQNSWIDAPHVSSDYIFRGALDTPAEPVSITRTADMTEDRMGTWVILENATYQSGALDTWAVKNDLDTPDDDAAYGEQVFTLSGGGNITVRTSGYAKFADTPLPFAAGARVTLKGVLTKFNTTYQLVLNTDKDVTAEN
jgi:hypothetical protein